MGERQFEGVSDLVDLGAKTSDVVPGDIRGLGDDELLAALVRLYNGWAGGCADRIADLDGRAMLRFSRTGKVGDDVE